MAGVDDVTFMEFVLDNNDSGDVNTTSVTVQATGTGAASTYSNFTAAIFVDGTQQGSAKNLSSTGAATFNDLSVIIPSAGQKEFEVVLDTIESSATSNPANTSLASNFTAVNVASAIAAGATTITVSDASGLAVGDQIAISEDGTATGSNAEVKLSLIHI